MIFPDRLLDLEVVSAPKRFSSLSFSARLEVRNLVGETRLLLRKGTDALTEPALRPEIKRRHRRLDSEKNTRTSSLQTRASSAPPRSRSKRV
jgi:hypothetical protein